MGESNTIYGEGVIIAILFVGLVLLGTVKRLQRGRPGFAIGQAVAVAFGIRLLAMVAINATGLGASLRGGDETTFMDFAKMLAAQPLGSAYFPHGDFQLMTVLFALQLKLGFINDTGIRVTQIGQALLGAVLINAAVYDMAGARAARLSAWLMAFEPGSIFFSSEIHRESLLELATGLVVFGGCWFWKRLDVRGILICAVGCFFAIETRSYAGWFLACAVVMLILHASLRNMARSPRALPFIYAIVIAAFIVGPTLLAATGGRNLKKLQASQAANAHGVGEGGATGTANGSNLALESVDFSSRGAVITSLPTKIRELVLEPYPWELRNLSEAFGAIGTLVAYALLVLLIRYAWVNRGQIFGRAGPLLYPLLFELVCYSLTTGNAGTGFRYRTHLVTLAIGAVAILREGMMEARAEAANGLLAGRTRRPDPARQPLTA